VFWRVGQCWTPPPGSILTQGNDFHSDAKRGPNSHTFKLSEKAIQTPDKTLNFFSSNRLVFVRRKPSNTLESPLAGAKMRML